MARLRGKAVWWLIAILAVTGLVGWLKRDAIALALFARAVDAAMARNLPARLDPDALHIGFCGTGSPLPGRDRGEACTFAVAGGRVFIFDAGEGAARTLGAMGVGLDRLEGVWLTHLHSDHFNGLGNLALQRWAGTSAKTPLAVFGPDGVTEVTQGLTAAYRLDSSYRIAHHAPQVVPPSGFGLAGNVIGAGVVYDRGGVRITAFPVNHAPVAPAFGYRIDWNGHSATISGDTAASPALVAAARGSDLLVHEVLSPRLVGMMADAAQRKGQAARAKILRDIQSYHTSPEGAADAARAAGVGMLAFTHIVPPLPRFMEGALINGAPQHFPGPIRIMHDGDLISITAKASVSETNLLQ